MYIEKEINWKPVKGPTTSEINNNYSDLSTLMLIEKIVNDADQNILNYFISNRKLLWYKGKRVLLPEYLYELKNINYYPFISITSNEKHLDLKLDLTYDRAIKKFIELSSEEENEGPFCDKQYQSLVKQLNDYKRGNPNCSELELESECERRFQKMVIRHLSYSWLEVCRSSNRLYQRYRWELPTGTVEVKKPQHIDGRSFNRWLVKHVEEPNPVSKREKCRIQKIIDDWFGVLGEIDSSDIEYKLKEESDPYDTIEKYPEDFISMIASEKASSVKILRPAISKIGKSQVYLLVKKILESLQFDDSKDSQIQQEFGLSKSTYSRFAGKEWREKNNGEVPDLWKNIATIVTKDPIISEHAESIGVNKAILKLLGKEER